MMASDKFRGFLGILVSRWKREYGIRHFRWRELAVRMEAVLKDQHREREDLWGLQHFIRF